MGRSAEALFLGSHTNNIDSKGRIASPADFRKALDLDSFKGFYCVPSLMGPHLDCGGPSYIKALRAMIAAFDPFDPDRAALQEALIGRSRAVTFDADGRFNLPAFMREHAGLEDRAFFIGLGDTFQIRSAAGADDRMAEAVVAARRVLGKLKNPVFSPGEGA